MHSISIVKGGKKTYVDVACIDVISVVVWRQFRRQYHPSIIKNLYVTVPIEMTCLLRNAFLPVHLCNLV